MRPATAHDVIEVTKFELSLRAEPVLKLAEATPITAAEALCGVFETMYGANMVFKIEFWDGSFLGPEDASFQVRIKTPLVIRRAIWGRGGLGLARSCVLGEIDFAGDVFGHIGIVADAERNGWETKIGLRTVVKTTKALHDLGVLGGPLPSPEEEAPAPRGRIHTKLRDVSAITHHYDVSNEFYRLVLGESMTYSCARFTDESLSLQAAQEAKFDLVSRKLDLKPGMRLLDVGCGWGGMALHAATHYGVKVVGVTLSPSQAEIARHRVREAGLTDLIEIRIQDYRDVSEKFDAISSIGMFEHVGHENTASYFNTLYSLLAPGGRLLNHAISRVGGEVMQSRSFIGRYVFPDGDLQDLGATIGAMEQIGFEIRDVESLREHYALTLRHWVDNLTENWHEAIGMVGEVRARVWWLYMVASAANFDRNYLNLHQVLAVKADDEGVSGMPLTRHSFV